MTRYQYLDDFRRGISVFVIFPYGIAVLGNPNVPLTIVSLPLSEWMRFFAKIDVS